MKCNYKLQKFMMHNCATCKRRQKSKRCFDCCHFPREDNKSTECHWSPKKIDLMGIIDDLQKAA